MALVRENSDVEEWVGEFSNNWMLLTDKEYHQLIQNWKELFCQIIETRQRSPYGGKAQIKFNNILSVEEKN